MDELRVMPANVVDLDAVRRRELEDRELRILADAVGEHPLPPERRAELDHRVGEFGPTAA